MSDKEGVQTRKGRRKLRNEGENKLYYTFNKDNLITGNENGRTCNKNGSK